MRLNGFLGNVNKVLLIRYTLQQFNLIYQGNNRCFFGISNLVSILFRFFLLASNSLFDVTARLVRSTESFFNTEHDMMIFFKNCNIFTKAVYLKTDL